MAESDQLNPVQNRFSMANPVVNTARVLFDASELQTGPLADMTDDEMSDPANFVQQLTRNWETMFPDATVAGAASNSGSTHVNEVTLDSSSKNVVVATSASTTIAEDIALQPTASEEDYANELSELAANLHGAPPKRQRRSRVSFARRFFHAKSETYLQVNPNHPLPTSTPELIGQVMTCPTKKNNYLFSINWIHPVGEKTWPVDLKQHVRCFFPKDDLSLLLPEMMKRYDDHQEHAWRFSIRTWVKQSGQ
jgi:hypothetical protein